MDQKKEENNWKDESIYVCGLNILVDQRQIADIGLTMMVVIEAVVKVTGRRWIGLNTAVLALSRTGRASITGATAATVVQSIAQRQGLLGL